MIRAYFPVEKDPRWVAQMKGKDLAEAREVFEWKCPEISAYDFKSRQKNEKKGIKSVQTMDVLSTSGTNIVKLLNEATDEKPVCICAPMVRYSK